MSLRTIAFVFLLVTTPVLVFAQDTSPKPMPPEAQEALRKGVIAAKSQDYLLAIRYFEDARKVAPDAPELFFNLGLAESKVPGRELRSMAWFGAYLAANPNAANAAAVKEQIEQLEVKSQSNIERLLSGLKDMAAKVPDDKPAATAGAKAAPMRAMAAPARAKAGPALGATTVVAGGAAEIALDNVGRLYACAGDEATAVRIEESLDSRSLGYALKRRYVLIADDLIIMGDLTAAQAWLNRAGAIYPDKQSDPHGEAEKELNEARSRLNAGQTEAQTKTQKGARDVVREWTSALESTYYNSDGVTTGLNTPPFVDFSGYLKSLSEGTQPPDEGPGRVRQLSNKDPIKIFWNVWSTAEIVINQQLKIERRMKEQLKR